MIAWDAFDRANCVEVAGAIAQSSFEPENNVPEFLQHLVAQYSITEFAEILSEYETNLLLEVVESNFGKGMLLGFALKTLEYQMDQEYGLSDEQE